MHIYQNSLTIETTPQALWSLWTQTDQWSSWDPGIKVASSDQHLKLGATGTLTTAKGNVHAFKVVLCDPSSSLMLSYQLSIGVEINIKRSWEKVPQGIQVTQEITLIGPMAPLAQRLRKDTLVQMTDASLVGMKNQLEGLLPVSAPVPRMV